MWHRIVVPLDGSRLAEYPIVPALGLARRSGAEVCLVRVHCPVPDADSGSYGDALQRSVAEHYLSRVRGRLLAQYRAVVDTTLLEGDPAQALCRFVNETSDRDVLVMMATHGRTGLRRVLMGSTADRILRRSDAPVLLFHPSPDVPQDSWDGFNRIVVALDGTDKSEHLLEPAAHLARLSGASLHLLRVVVPDVTWPSFVVLRADAAAMAGRVATECTVAEHMLEALAERVSAAFPEVSLSLETVTGMSAARGVLACARDCHADVVAVATHATTLSRWFSGNVTSKLLESGPRALLVMHPRGVSRELAGHGVTREASASPVTF